MKCAHLTVSGIWVLVLPLTVELRLRSIVVEFLIVVAIVVRRETPVWCVVVIVYRVMAEFLRWEAPIFVVVERPLPLQGVTAVVRVVMAMRVVPVVVVISPRVSAWASIIVIWFGSRGFHVLVRNFQPGRRKVVLRGLVGCHLGCPSHGSDPADNFIL